MAAGVNGCMTIMATDGFFNLLVILAVAFGQKNKVGPTQGIGRLAQDPPWKNMLVAERILTIDEEQIESVAKPEVLEAVVQEKGVGLVLPDGMAGRFDPVGIHQDGHAGKVACEHEGFVPGLGGIEKDRFSVRDHSGRGGGASRKKSIRQTGKERLGDTFVAPAEDGDPAARFLEGAGEFFDDGCFACASDGEVTDADNHHADRVAAENGVLVKAGANAHNARIDGREEEKERLEKGGSTTRGAIEDDIGRKLFQGFESL